MALAAPAAANVTGDQWHLDAMEMDKVHEISTGEGITVGIVDTGVDVTHPDLEGADIRGRGFGGAQRDGLRDDDGHGTNVASMVVGQGVGTDTEDGVLGIAPDVELLTASLRSPEDIGRLEDHSAWVDEGVRWLVDEGADVISVSVGSVSVFAFEYARDHEVVVVYAAGNVDEDEWGNELDPNAQGQPGSVVINAGDPHGEPSEYAVEFRSGHFGFTAPGVDIPVATLDGGYEMAEGASLAAPLAAGMWALVMSVYPDLSEEQLFHRMIWDKYPDAEPNELPEGRGGYGPIDPLRALTLEIPGQDMTGPPSESEEPVEEDPANGDHEAEDPAAGDEETEPAPVPHGAEEPANLSTGADGRSQTPFALGAIALLTVVVLGVRIALVRRKRLRAQNSRSARAI